MEFLLAILIYRQNGGRAISRGGWQLGDPGEKIKCNALLSDAHDDALGLVVRGNNPVLARWEKNDFQSFLHADNIG